MTTQRPSVPPTEAGRSYWERNARRYDRSLRLLGQAVPRMLEQVVSELRPEDEVLEVAAGTGLVTTAAANVVRRIVATDYSDRMIALLRAKIEARGLCNVECQTRNLYALGFEPSSFDVVIAANVLHLVPDLPGALAALANVLRPGGRLLAPTFCHDETFVSRMVSRGLSLTGFPGKRRFTLLGLCQGIEASGFRVGRREMLPGVIPIGFVVATKEGAGLSG